jgi:hypothetical protein
MWTHDIMVIFKDIALNEMLTHDMIIFKDLVTPNISASWKIENVLQINFCVFQDAWTFYCYSQSQNKVSVKVNVKDPWDRRFNWYHGENLPKFNPGTS